MFLLRKRCLKMNYFARVSLVTKGAWWTSTVTLDGVAGYASASGAAVVVVVGTRVVVWCSDVVHVLVHRDIPPGHYCRYRHRQWPLPVPPWPLPVPPWPRPQSDTDTAKARHSHSQTQTNSAKFMIFREFHQNSWFSEIFIRIPQQLTPLTHRHRHR